MKKVVSATPSKTGFLDVNKENINRTASKKNSEPRSAKKAFHKKSSSYQFESFNNSPSKSRFDSSFIPTMSINHFDIRSEISKISNARKKSEMQEKRLSRFEWSTAKKKMKNSAELETKLHEFDLTSHKIELNRLISEKEAEMMKLRKKEKIESFIDFNNAIKTREVERKGKESEDLKNERQKSILIQKEILDKKERVKLEREEKRKNFQEFLEAQKKLKESEKIREKKELKYEMDARIFEEKNLLTSKTRF